MDFVEQCVDESLLPGSQWNKIREELKNYVAEYTRGNLEDRVKKNALVNLLGYEFFLDYVAQHPQEFPDLVKDTSTDIQDEKELREVIRIKADLLKNTEAVLEPYRYVIDAHFEDIVQEVLGRHLTILENELREQTEEELLDVSDPRLNEKSETTVINIPPWLRPKTVFDLSNRSTFGSIAAYPETLRRHKFRVHKEPSKVPLATGPQSEEVGKILAQTIENNPSLLPELMERFADKQLPFSLRKLMWLYTITGGASLKEKGYQYQEMKEAFTRYLIRADANNPYGYPTKTEISSLIEHTVIEIFESTPATQCLNTESTMKELIRALNVFYTHSKNFEPRMVLFLIPLQISLMPQRAQPEDVIDLAHLLVMLLTQCVPTWPQIVKMADDALNRLQALDQELYDHLRTAAKLRIPSYLKDIAAEFFHKSEFSPITNEKPAVTNPPRASQLEQENHETSRVNAQKNNEQKETLATEQNDSKNVSMPAEAENESLPKPNESSTKQEEELKADPAIFIRKWMADCFVSVLDINAVLLVWDRLMMTGWSAENFINISLVLVELLRDKFLATKSFEAVRIAFLYEPCKLYTKDVRDALEHVSNGRPWNQVRDINRHAILAAKLIEEEKETALASSVNFLPSSQLSDLYGKLYIPHTSPIYSESLLRKSDFIGTEMGFTLSGFAFLGDQFVAQRNLESPALLIDAADDLFGQRIVLFHWTGGVTMLFDNIDATKLLAENKIDTESILHAVFILFYTDDLTATKLPIGWSWQRLVLRQLSESEVDKDRAGQALWVVERGNQHMPIHAFEDMPDIVANLVVHIPECKRLVSSNETNILGPESYLDVLLHDSLDAPPEREKNPTIEDDEILFSDDEQPDIAVAASRQQPPTVDHEEIPQKEEVVVATVSAPTSGAPEVTRSCTPEPNIGFVLYNPLSNEVEENPAPTPLSEGFNLYIDRVRFIPDNATFIQIACSIYNFGSKPVQFNAVADLPTSARSPIFGTRFHIAPSMINKKKLNANLLIVMKMFTYEDDTSKLAGGCFIEPFDRKSKKLRCGGHQLLMRYGDVPVKKSTFGGYQVDEKTFNQLPRLPGTSTLIRLLPYAQNYSPCPVYSDGYYKQRLPYDEPNVTDKNFTVSYVKDLYKFPQLSRYFVEKARQEQSLPQSATAEHTSQWIQYVLSVQSSPPPMLTFNGFVKYDRQFGLHVKVEQAFGMPAGLYCNCIGRIWSITSGNKTRGGSDSFDIITTALDYSALSFAPKWNDKPPVVFPPDITTAVLDIEIHGLQVNYVPMVNQSAPGRIENVPNSLGKSTLVAHGQLELNDNQFVNVGTHVFSLSLSTQFRYEDPETKKTSKAALLLKIWNGQYERIEETPPLPKKMWLDNEEAAWFNNNVNVTKGPQVRSLITENYADKDRKRGAKAGRYAADESHFDQQMSEMFYKLALSYTSKA